MIACNKSIKNLLNDTRCRIVELATILDDLPMEVELRLGVEFETLTDEALPPDLQQKLYNHYCDAVKKLLHPVRFNQAVSKMTLKPRCTENSH